MSAKLISLVAVVAVNPSPLSKTLELQIGRFIDMERVEEKIRLKLVQNLEIFGEGLTLIGQESFLPNKNGTRGFVDILAADSQNRHVLIELKRSKAASREAIHEVFKYIEGIKENKSLKHDEIVAYIVSTEWSELIVPFSSLVSKVEFEVIGFHLKVDREFNPIEAARVEPLNIQNERFISDQHAVCLYSSKVNLGKGIDSHVECFNSKEIEDYLLLILKAHPDFHEMNLRATAKGLEDIASQFDGKPLKTYDDLKNSMPNYKYMIYSAVQGMSKEKYWKIIQMDADQYDEMLEIAEDMEEEELLQTLHEYAVENTNPRPFQEHYEIGYPAKLGAKIIEAEGWGIIEVIRKGTLEKNELLSDELLINELTGDSGTNKQVYSKDFSSSNKASLDQIRKDVGRCLVDNEIWLGGINKAITEIPTLYKEIEYQSRIHIFNPSNTLISLFRSATSPSQIEATRWVPSYYINIESEELKVAYFGCLVRNSSKQSLKNVLINSYDGNSSKLLFSLTWGGYQSNDIDISPLYGLEYANFKCEVRGGERLFYKFDGFRYHSCGEIDPYREYFLFMNENTNFIEEIVELFEEATLTPGVVQF